MIKSTTFLISSGEGILNVLPTLRVVIIHHCHYFTFFFLRKIIAFEHYNCPLTTVDPGPFLQ